MVLDRSLQKGEYSPDRISGDFIQLDFEVDLKWCVIFIKLDMSWVRSQCCINKIKQLFNKWIIILDNKYSINIYIFYNKMHIY